MAGSPDWPQADLVRRLTRVLTIAERALDALGETGYHDEAAPEDSFGPDKPLAETGMLVHVAARVDDPRVQERVATLTARIGVLTHSDRTAVALALYPSIAWQLAMPHILVRGPGAGDTRLDRLLEANTGASAAEGREVPPHRALERRWLQAVWRGETGLDGGSAVGASVLSHPVDLLLGARDDAYAFTHGLMYLSGFGAWQPSLPRPAAEVLAEAAGLLARALVLEDYDLAAEVLMAWPLTGSAWSPAARFGFRVLAEFEDEVGYLLAGNGIPGRYQHLSGQERTTYALAASYHTTYVWGILCALAGLPGDHLPHDDGTPTDEGLIEELRALIPDADTPWQRSYARLGAAARSTLGPFLVDAALLSAARRSDFVSLGRVLQLAVAAGLADSPGCAQAAELLHRLTLARQVPARATT